MPVSLGAILLDDNLLLPDLKNLPTLAGSFRQTITGKIIDQKIPIGSGQTLSLSDPGAFGLFTGDQIDAINALKTSREKIVFVHHLGIWTVIVKDVEVQPEQELANPTGSDRYYGTITLLVV